MKKVVISILAVSMLNLLGSKAGAEWTNLSNGLNELDIQSLAIDSKEPQIIFAGSEKRVYKTVDNGNKWKQILTVRGSDNRVRAIYPDPSDSKGVYVCTEHGLLRSEDGGKRWNTIFSGVGDRSKAVYCVASDIQDPLKLWIGTGSGLFSWDTRTRASKKIDGLPAAKIYSILLNNNQENSFFVATEKGIYKSIDRGQHWERVFTNQAPASENGEKLTLEQFDIEEIPNDKIFSNIVFLADQSKFYAASEKGVLEGSNNGSAWLPLKGQALPDQKINFITKSSKTFYIGTDQGIFQWDPNAQCFREIYKGLESSEVRILSYSPSGDFLLAGTKKGVFRLSYPELYLSVLENKPRDLPQLKDILAQFKNEPAIGEIQKVAIQYAEVSPKKIESWRRGAALKALLPTLAVSKRVGTDQNVDIDRGGTADPDQFIIGPAESTSDWSVGVSWDLADLIWNGDQTSIDTRSRLMVELRDDVLNEVTHLYYERRRLQVEMAMAPMRDLAIQIEKEIRLQELTAGIDALTGGYLSKRLGEIQTAPLPK